MFVAKREQGEQLAKAQAEAERCMREHDSLQRHAHEAAEEHARVIAGLQRQLALALTVCLGPARARRLGANRRPAGATTHAL
jgi:hypothetical protein